MTARKVSGHTIAARSAAVLVALVAGAASFSHISSVALAAGERPWVAYALPLAIDGLIVVGVAALLEDKRARLRPRPVARLAVLVGVIATLAANIASAQPTWTGRLVAVAAPVAFLLATEVLTRTGRRVAMADIEAVAEPAEPVTVAAPEPAPVAEIIPEPAPAPRPRKARPRAPSAAERVVKAVTRTPAASPAAIAARLSLSERTVTRHWPRSDDTVSPEPAPAERINGRPVELVGVTQ